MGLHFRRQQIIEGFIVDFYCHAARLVVEIDGAVHEDRAEYDAERTRILMGQDLAILRFTNDQIDADLNSVLATIQSTVLNRIAELSSPFPGTAPPFQGRGPGG